MRNCTIVAAFIVVLAAPSRARAQATEPRLPRARTLAELGTGFGVGVAGIITGAMAGALTAQIVRKQPWRGGDDQVDPIVLTGMIAGHVLASSYGVYTAGRQTNVRESFGWTVAGAAAAEVAGVLIMERILRKANGDDRAILPSYLVAAVSAPIGATIAFNASRKAIASGGANLRAAAAAPPMLSFTIRF